VSKFPFPINLGGDDSQLVQWIEELPKGSDLTDFIKPSHDWRIHFERKPIQEKKLKSEPSSNA
jgi:hypothetical protein